MAQTRRALTSSSPHRPGFAFLLGSGISVHAGMPRTSDLSDFLVAGRRVVRDTQERYRIVPEDHVVPPQERAGNEALMRQLMLLLSQLKAEADTFYGSSRRSHYEDWYYLADQLPGALQGKFDNPAVADFAEKLQRRMARAEVFPMAEKGALHRAVNQLCLYMRDIVLESLALPLKPIKVDWIVRGATDPEAPWACQGVFTLNHDILLETLFEREKLPYTVGFDREIDASGLLHWDRDGLFPKDGRTVIAKLHGSIDWFHQNRKGNLDAGARLDAFRGKGAKSGDALPLLLIGRHNKVLQYTRFLLEDLHHRFYISLRQSRLLVICGYGFGDEGINARIRDWKYAERSNVIVYVREEHPFFDFHGANLGFHPDPMAWDADQTLVHVPRKAETVTWDEIVAAVEHRGPLPV